MSSIIKSRTVLGPPAAETARSMEGRAACAQASRRGVRVIHTGDVARALEVTCACGEVTVVELEYVEPAVPSEAASK